MEYIQKQIQDIKNTLKHGEIAMIFQVPIRESLSRIEGYLSMKLPPVEKTTVCGCPKCLPTTSTIRIGK